MSPTPSPPVAEHRFGAMGSDVHVVVVGGGPGLVALARDIIVGLERRWSRFLPDSEVSRMNAGGRVEVSAATRTLVRCGLHGWHRSGGWFDPGVHDAIVAAGYDRDLRAVRTGGVRAKWAVAEPAGRPTPGWQGLEIDDVAGTVELPAGVRFDPGGIGKGLAADLVTAELVAAGATGVCVNVGGDLRVAGMPPDGSGWRVGLAVQPRGRHPTLHLRHGAVATSGTLRRRWLQHGRMQHHVIDPHTGSPAAIGYREVTAVAATSWEAEVAAKVAALAPDDRVVSLLSGLAAGALIADDRTGRSVRLVGRVDRFLIPETRTGVGATP